LLKREIVNQIAILKINRPAQMNALNKALFAAFIDEIGAIQSNNAIRGVVITGEGEKAFCAGIDLKERANKKPSEILDDRDRYIRPMYSLLANLEKPTIAAINGVALGGGAELALACDLRIASLEGGKFGQTEIRWGMIPSCGACQRLRLLTGMGIAKELIMSGRIIDAEEAYRLGIFNRVVPSPKIMKTAMEMIEAIASNSPIAVSNAKKVLEKGANTEMALDYEYAASLECFIRGNALGSAKKF
jgi:enoyl-CoA hydratase/carnithine racemase